MAMSAFKSFAMLMLALILGVAMQEAVAQETSPTAAPTSAPTTASDTGAPPPSSSTIKPTPVGPGEEVIGVSPTSSPTTEPEDEEPKKPKTKFTSKIAVARATDFDADAYLATLASEMDVPGGNVAVKSIDYVVAVSYSFAGDVTEAEVASGAASAFGVPESQVSVTLSRRLRADSLRADSEGRRLATTAAVEISYDSPTAADAGSTTAADPTKITAGISAATGKTVAAPTVLVAPAVEVVVVTEVVSTTDTAVQPPAAADIASGMKAITGKDFTVETADVEITMPPTTTSSSTTVAPSSSSSTSANAPATNTSTPTPAAEPAAAPAEASGAEKLSATFGGVMTAVLAMMLVNSF